MYTSHDGKIRVIPLKEALKGGKASRIIDVLWSMRADCAIAISRDGDVDCYDVDVLKRALTMAICMIPDALITGTLSDIRYFIATDRAYGRMEKGRMVLGIIASDEGNFDGMSIEVIPDKYCPYKKAPMKMTGYTDTSAM